MNRTHNNDILPLLFGYQTRDGRASLTRRGKGRGRMMYAVITKPKTTDQMAVVLDGLFALCASTVRFVPISWYRAVKQRWLPAGDEPNGKRAWKGRRGNIR